MVDSTSDLVDRGGGGGGILGVIGLRSAWDLGRSGGGGGGVCKFRRPVSDSAKATVLNRKNTRIQQFITCFLSTSGRTGCRI